MHLSIFHMLSGTAEYRISHSHGSSSATRVAVCGKKDGTKLLPCIAKQLPYHDESSPDVTFSIHAQYVAGTGGKACGNILAAYQSLGAATQISHGLIAFIRSARMGLDPTVRDIFAALSICSGLAHLQPEMAESVEDLTPEQLQRVATAVKSNSGKAGGKLTDNDLRNLLIQKLVAMEEMTLDDAEKRALDYHPRADVGKVTGRLTDIDLKNLRIQRLVAAGVAIDDAEEDTADFHPQADGGKVTGPLTDEALRDLLI